MDIENEDNKKENNINEKALNLLPFSVCFASNSLAITFANSSFLKLTGYEKAEILGENIDFLFSDKDLFSNTIERLKLENPISEKGVLVRNKKNQSFLSHIIFSCVFKGGDIEGYSFVFFQPDYLQEVQSGIQEKFLKVEQDAKDLVQARMALINILEDADEDRRKAEMERDKTLSIITNLADGLITVEKETITLINPAANDFFQTTEKEILGKSLVGLAQHPTVGLLVAIIKKEKTPFLKKELSISESLKVEVSAILFGQENKNIIVILHDITRESFIEKMKTEFVSIAAHQLRTPLSGTKWILKMFLDGDIGEITSTQSDFLQKTYNSNERMINLVNDLLNVTKIEEGRFLQKPQKSDVPDILSKAVELAKNEAQRKGLSFEVVLPDKNFPKVEVDKEKIILAVQNVVENAVAYTKTGKITVSANYSKPENSYIIAVKDTGIGIPNDQKERIFSRFFRGSTAVKTETEGTGLGLFISKNIIEAHNGKIWFDSKEGEGTAFYISIPAERAGEQEG